MSMIFAQMYANQAMSGSSAAEGAARDAKSAARHASRTAETLEARVERLALVCEAMWTLLRDKAGVTEEELIDRVMTIDLSDGTLDNKAQRKHVRKCHKCKRPVGKRFDRCMYCGAPVARDPFS